MEVEEVERAVRKLKVGKQLEGRDDEVWEIYSGAVVEIAWNVERHLKNGGRLPLCLFTRRAVELSVEITEE